VLLVVAHKLRNRHQVYPIHLAPNPAMLKQIFDRLLGRAREALEVEVPARPSTSDAELAASLTVLLHRLHPVNG
jgi:hypothetical protein